MESQENLIATILELAQGERVHAAIEARCKAQTPPRSIRDLCSESKVGLGTIWRMKSAKVIANLKPLSKIEKTFRKWER